MKIIGITGGIGSGKSTVSNILKNKYNIHVIDADVLSAKALNEEKVIEQLLNCYGKSVVKNNTVDKQAVADIVFNDSDKLKKLNDIIHPLVNKYFKQDVALCRKTGMDFAIYDCPLLIEAGLQNEVDITLVVYSDEEHRISRVVERSSLTEEEVRKRISSQMPLIEKIKYADYVIYNDDDMVGLEKAVDKFYEMLLNENFS